MSSQEVSWWAAERALSKMTNERPLLPEDREAINVAIKADPKRYRKLRRTVRDRGSSSFWAGGCLGVDPRIA